MICQYCGKKFKEKHHSQKYCCETCKKEARKIQNKKNRIRWEKKQEKKVLVKCRWCGKIFTRTKNSERRFFCSEKCKKEMNSKNNRDRQFKHYHQWHIIGRGCKKFVLGSSGLGKHRRNKFCDEIKVVKKEKRRLKI